MPSSKKETKRSRPVVEVVEESETPAMMPTPSEPEKVADTPSDLEEPSLPDTSPAPEEKGKTNFKLLVMVSVVTALVIGFVAGGVYVYFTGVKELKEDTTAETTLSTPPAQPRSTPEPTATPEPIDVSEYSISILNGSGKSGEANRANDLIEEDGFSVVNIGNATTFDYTDTIIQVTSLVPESVVQALQNSLSKEYSVKLGENLSDDSNYDIVITLGVE